MDEDAPARVKRPRMFALLESVDDEDIQEDAEEYRRLAFSNTLGEVSLSEHKRRRTRLLLGLDPESEITISPSHSPNSSPSRAKLDSIPEETVTAPTKASQGSDGQTETGLIEGYASSSEGEDAETEGLPSHKPADSTESSKLSAADLKRLGITDTATLPVIQATDIRDTQWEYKSGPDVWSPNKVRIEHGTMQKRKHQVSAQKKICYTCGRLLGLPLVLWKTNKEFKNLHKRREKTGRKVA
eukprot:Gregarina_sp_Poly_1__10901@NODE_850_length_5977_cov_89_644501_g614_i0_p2_GENE_NODE_850_length_5977_cov_89_644501_g614_i0NODE_850_length_5977_cov_89_644501_g614_i0_p2_ORF_typecomplete_len242_score28_24_NODE_850_length_5977_cov_89_644501_g614_i091816